MFLAITPSLQSGMYRPAGGGGGGDAGHGRGIWRGFGLGMILIFLRRFGIGGVVALVDEGRGLQGLEQGFVPLAAGDHVDGRALGAVGVDPVGVARGQADAAAGGVGA